MEKKIILTATLLMFVLLSTPYVLPGKSILLAFGCGAAIAIYFLVSAIRGKKNVSSLGFVSLLFFFLLLPLIFILGFYLFDIELSVIYLILLIGLTLTFFFNLLSVPPALYHKRAEEELLKRPLSMHPLVSIIVPAFNEEKCLGRTIETLLEVNYPLKEIIVVDDGSTDKTYEIADRYANRGVKAFHKPHGGKAAALNYGLLFSKGEIIVTVDADSLISRDSLNLMVKRFEDPRVKAVCGNVKVLNRDNLLTRCQALEYIISINIYRRMLDSLGSVTVVPGVLGAFRKDVLTGSGYYDHDTLTEDFDVTVKTLKAGSVVQASNSAFAYTEAPETLSGLYKQRLRWYRGNIQTLIKHRDAFFNPRFGFLQKLAFPFILLSQVFIPLVGVVVLSSAIALCLTGAVMLFLRAFILFTVLQTLTSILAIQLDEEDMKLAVYSPAFVIGYKQLCDFISVKSLFDVLLKRKMRWTRAKRKKGVSK